MQIRVISDNTVGTPRVATRMLRIIITLRISSLALIVKHRASRDIGPLICRIEEKSMLRERDFQGATSMLRLSLAEKEPFKEVKVRGITKMRTALNMDCTSVVIRPFTRESQIYTKVLIDKLTVVVSTRRLHRDTITV